MRRHVISGFALAIVAGIPTVSAARDLPALQYPAAVRGQVVDELHGTKVADPYRWMETPGPDVAAWVAAENAISQPYLDEIPAREAIRARLAELWDYEQHGYSWLDEKARVPVKRGARYFYVEKSGKQNQGVLYWSEAADAAARVLVDPNTLSQDGTASLPTTRSVPMGDSWPTRYPMAAPTG